MEGLGALVGAAMSLRVFSLYVEALSGEVFAESSPALLHHQGKDRCDQAGHHGA